MLNVIGDYKKKIIYIRNPKTGSTSIGGLLGKIKSIPRINIQNANLPMLPPNSTPIHHPRSLYDNMNNSHVPACWTRDAFGQDDWDSWNSFITIRNPWEKAVSFWNHGKSVHPTCKNFIHGNKTFRDWVLETQCNDVMYIQTMAYDYDGKTSLVKKIFDINDHDSIKSFMGVRSIPRKNVKKHAAYASYYDEDTVELIGKLFTEDIKIGNYKF